MLKANRPCRFCFVISCRRTLMTFIVSFFIIGTFFNLTIQVAQNKVNKDYRQDILNCFTSGHWTEKRGVTEADQQKIQVEFLETTWKKYGYSGTNQRTDNKCGNVTNGSALRALCDPKGSTPCCYNNKCIAKTTEQCKCNQNCFDIRQKQHAELHSWTPAHKNLCSFKMYTPQDACQLLKERGIGYISVIGDSLQRNLYSALVMTLSEDEYITTEQTEPLEIRERCSGMGHFSDKDCNVNHLKDDFLRTSVCGGAIHTQFAYIHKAQGLPYAILEVVRMWLWRGYYKNTMFLFSMGIHEDFNADYITSNYIKPLCTFINSLCDQKWLKLMWVTPHLPGVLKPPFHLNQQIDGVKNYVKKTNKILRQAGVPILNTHNVTDDVISWDGTHYGLGLNEALANIIFNYINKITS